VNFTREPIIETIITPKEGYKLIVRNSKGGSQEEYTVDAIEVVSFGHSFFFRSLERPKSFLVPVSDYEIVEVKETRVVLKNVSVERSIKIGGGREAAPKTFKEAPPERVSDAAAMEEGAFEQTSVEAIVEQRIDKKRDRRRHRRRRGQEERESREWMQKQKAQEGVPSGEPTEAKEAEQGGGAPDEAQVSSPSFSTLFPPPPTLISETLSRYKDQTLSEGHLPPRRLEEEKSKEEESHQRHYEEKKEEKKKDEEDDDHDPFGSEGTQLSRSRSYAMETSTQAFSSKVNPSASFDGYYFLT